MVKSAELGVAALLERFELYLVALGRSPATRRLYVSGVQRWLTRADSALHPSREALLAYFGERRRRVSRGTVNLDLAALRAFYRWTFGCGLTATDRRELLPGQVHVPPRLPRSLTDVEVGRLLAAPDLSTVLGFRDHVILRLLYETGARASELIALELTDVQDDATVWIRGGKGGRDRLQPISRALLGLLGEWERLRRALRPGKSLTCFIGAHGRPFTSPRAVWRVVDRYASRALGLSGGYLRLTRPHRRRPWQGVYPHLLRSTFATELLRGGCPITAIQELLGHERLSTTARYLDVDLAMLRRAHNLHPRARLVDEHGAQPASTRSRHFQPATKARNGARR